MNNHGVYKAYNENNELVFICSERIATSLFNDGLIQFLPNSSIKILDDISISKYADINGRKKKKCVVCGSPKNLTKHHIVPSSFLAYLPDNLKISPIMPSTVVICRNCHDSYETKADKLKCKLTEQYKDLNINIRSRQNLLNRAVESANCLLGLDKLRKTSRAIRNSNKFFIQKFGFVPNTIGLLAISNIKVTLFNSINYTYKAVVDNLVSKGEVNEFKILWREHFLEHAKPKYLPCIWIVRDII